MNSFTDRLFELEDKEYADFHGSLIPTVPRENIIGVRVPLARKLAKELAGSKDPKVAGERERFLKDLPHRYYDENLLHGLLISGMKDYEECMKYVDAFLPYVDNWAACDYMAPKVLGRHKDRLMTAIRRWAASDNVYTCRFGLKCLMEHFLDGDFKPEYLDIPASIHTEEYYVNMMIAWYYATALAKQWEATIPYIENNVLDTWIHNKTIQKAGESYRITPEQKEYLKKLKISKESDSFP